MRLTLMVALGACADRWASDVRHAPHQDLVEVTDGDTDPDADTDTDSDSDTDADTDTDTDTDTGDGANPQGVDVSHWDGDIDWQAVADDDIGFAYVKATQGTTFRDPNFDAMYDGSAAAGLFRGAYHFAEPDSSDGAAQADFFVDNGGDWAADGQTLPGALDIEWNPNGPDCYGLDPDEMAAWIVDFVDEYAALTGRPPPIYCGATWWSECVADSDFSLSPLWVANWNVSSPRIPGGWSESDYTFWQYGGGDVAGIPVEADVDVFQGSKARLRAFADGTE
jgi:GH25 family lysozyme M1 (1,4-beta-N-acetylmuramidase)